MNTVQKLLKEKNKGYERYRKYENYRAELKNCLLAFSMYIKQKLCKNSTWHSGYHT